MTSKALAKQDSEPLSPPTKLPCCVFMLGDEKQSAVLIKDLREGGIRAFFVTSEEQLATETSRPECFAIFVNLKFLPAGMTGLRNRKTPFKGFWIAVGGRLTTQQSSALYNLGIADVLTLPVHPFTYRSRARQLLTRFVRKFGMADDVLLPSGVNRPLAGGLERGAMSNIAPVTNGVRNLKLEEGAAWRHHASTENAARSMVSLAKHSGTYGKHKSEEGRLPYYEKAMSHLAPAPQLFQNIVQPKRRERFLKEAEKRNCQATLWIQHQKWKGIFEVLAYDTKSGKISLRYPDGVGPKFFEDLFKNTKTNRLFVSLPLGRARIFFSNVVLGNDLLAGNIVMRSPSEIFETQRRTHFRLHMEDPKKFKVKVSAAVEQPEREYGIADLSANGCKLCVSEAEVGLFERGRICPKVVFKIYDQTIECAAVVRWKKDLRVGLQFLYLKQEDEEGIQLFVLEESYTYLKTHVEPG